MIKDILFFFAIGLGGAGVMLTLAKVVLPRFLSRDEDYYEQLNRSERGEE